MQGKIINQYVTESLEKDRLVCGVLGSRLRERLLREIDLMLEKAVAICKASELSQFQLKALESGSTNKTSNLDALRKEIESKNRRLAIHSRLS